MPTTSGQAASARPTQCALNRPSKRRRKAIQSAADSTVMSTSSRTQARFCTRLGTLLLRGADGPWPGMSASPTHGAGGSTMEARFPEVAEGMSAGADPAGFVANGTRSFVDSCFAIALFPRAGPSSSNRILSRFRELAMPWGGLAPSFPALQRAEAGSRRRSARRAMLAPHGNSRPGPGIGGTPSPGHGASRLRHSRGDVSMAILARPDRVHPVRAFHAGLRTRALLPRLDLPGAVRGLDLLPRHHGRRRGAGHARGPLGELRARTRPTRSGRPAPRAGRRLLRARPRRDVGRHPGRADPDRGLPWRAADPRRWLRPVPDQGQRGLGAVRSGEGGVPLEAELPGDRLGRGLLRGGQPGLAPGALRGSRDAVDQPGGLRLGLALLLRGPGRLLGTAATSGSTCA